MTTCGLWVHDTQCNSQADNDLLDACVAVPRRLLQDCADMISSDVDSDCESKALEAALEEQKVQLVASVVLKSVL